jgi:hypothetical protein
MDIVEHAINRIEFNEHKINESLKELKELKDNLIVKYKHPEIDIKRLLQDEKYRYIIALKLSKNNVETAKLLGTTERTFYRKMNEFNLHNQ